MLKRACIAIALVAAVLSVVSGRVQAFDSPRSLSSIAVGSLESPVFANASIAGDPVGDGGRAAFLNSFVPSEPGEPR